MKREPDELTSEPISSPQERARATQPLYLLVAWILLLVLGVFYLFAALSDLASDARSGIPSDHLNAFQALAGVSWSAVQQAASTLPGMMTHYITQLEIAYAVHELVFALLFLIIVAIPFRQRARWAWWACWIPMLANLTYTFTLAHYSTNTLAYSLIADIALPVLLLIHIPAFFGRARQPASSS
jgi:hypothetical protein